MRTPYLAAYGNGHEKDSHAAPKDPKTYISKRADDEAISTHDSRRQITTLAYFCYLSTSKCQTEQRTAQ